MNFDTTNFNVSEQNDLRNFFDKEIKVCQVCRKSLTIKKIRRHSKFCNKHCQKINARNAYRESNLLTSLSTSTTGAIAELLVSTDLLIKKYDVFRSLSPTASFDLAVYKDDVFRRVEVTSGRYSTKGNICYPKKDRSKSDILAVYTRIDNKIHYFPKLEV